MSEDAQKSEDLFSTWKRAAFHPGTLYAGDVPATRTGPLVFAMIVGTVAPVANALAGWGFGGAVALAILAPIGTVNGRPVLPASNAKLAPALDKCLSARPPLAETTPPPGRR